MSGKDMRTTVLVVDDHDVVIQGIKSILSPDPGIHVIGEARDGRIAVEKAKELQPNIVIMDVSMPNLNGIDSARQIKETNPQIQIIIYTMYSDREYIIDLFKSGISAYVLKEDPTSDLLLAVKAAQSGGTFFSTQIPMALLTHIRELETKDGVKRAESDTIQRLSMREREIFQMLAEGKKAKHIAEELYISPRTVESHKYNIMQKLDAENVTDLTKLAIKKKLIKI